MSDDIVSRIAKKTDSKIVLLVMDGIGDLPFDDTGKTPLETAKTPNLDRLAAAGVTGCLDPVAPGVTPGSGPGHMALFGYDPVECLIGRGVLAALGIGFDLTERDVAARVNFCTLDSDGNVTDRRAGRIPTDENERIVAKLKSRLKAPDGVEVLLRTVSEHRALLVVRGDGLGAKIDDTDPQQTGVPPLDFKAHDDASERTVAILQVLADQVREILADEPRANGVLLRGFDSMPDIPTFAERYKLTAAAIAGYPMYRGVAKLVGMNLLRKAQDIPDLFTILEEAWQDYDFFFVHVKYTDKYGEDGKAAEKIKVIEEIDALMPRVEALGPDVLVVAGDHSTPCVLKSHSWHPVPALLSAKTALPDDVTQYGERAVAHGGLGRMAMSNLMRVALGHALKLDKFGA